MADVAIGSANISVIQLTETTTPATGAATKWKLYVKTDGLYTKDDAGTEHKIGAGALPTIDIDGGSIDGATIGAATPANGTFLTLNARDSLVVYTSSGTATCGLEIGNGRNGNGISYIDLIGDATYSDYGFRILRNNGGANTTSQLIHRGTGDFELRTSEAGQIAFYTNATLRFLLKANGDMGFFGGGGGAKPTVTGSRGGNAALASLLTGGATLGLWTDSSTA